MAGFKIIEHLSASSGLEPKIALESNGESPMKLSILRQRSDGSH